MSHFLLIKMMKVILVTLTKYYTTKIKVDIKGMCLLFWYNKRRKDKIIWKEKEKKIEFGQLKKKKKL